MSTKLVCVADIVAESCELSNSTYVSDVVSPSALLGLIGAIMKKMDRDPYRGFKVGALLHELDIGRGRLKGGRGEGRLKGGREGKVTDVGAPGGETQDRTLQLQIRDTVARTVGRVKFSLFVEMQSDVDHHWFADLLLARRLQGGPLFRGERDALLFRAEVFDDLAEMASHLRYGYFLAPTSGRPVSFGDKASLTEVIHSFAIDPEHEQAKSAARRAALAAGSLPEHLRRRYFIPIPVGYQALEREPTMRAGTRYCSERDEQGRAPHIFVTDGAGSAELIYSRSEVVSELNIDDLTWAYDTSEEGKIFFSSKYTTNGANNG